MFRSKIKIPEIIAAACLSLGLCSCTTAGGTEIKTASWSTDQNSAGSKDQSYETKISEAYPENETAETTDYNSTYYSAETESLPLETNEKVTSENNDNETVTYETPSESYERESIESPLPAAAEPTGTINENSDNIYEDLPSYEDIPKTWDFTEDMVFAGDSICRGFGANKIVDSSRVMARGNVATWSFFEYEMYRDGSGLDFSSALKQADPKYVMLSMGMNDVNMIESDQFCDNYKQIIDTALDSCEAEIFVCAITPVNSRFASNKRISDYNDCLKEMIADNYSEKIHFVDYAKYLKDASGNLRNECDSGDGVHLSYYSYYIALWEISKLITA